MDIQREQEEENSGEVTVGELFFLFLTIGALTIGGGFAMIPFIRREMIEKKGWLSDQGFLDNLAIAQSLPGPIVVNLSMLTGYRLRGLKGGLFSLLGAIIPSFVIILAIAIFFWHYRDIHLVQAAFMGIKPIVLALIVSAVIKLGRQVLKEYRPLILFLFFLTALMLCNIHPIAIVISGAIAGVLRLLDKDGKKEQAP